MNDSIGNGRNEYVSQPVTSNYHTEETAPGITLQNYVKRTPSDDGTYVIVVTHCEKIEKIPQPPTPEEIAARKKEDRIVFSVIGSLGLALMGFVGWVVYADEKNYRREREMAQNRELDRVLRDVIDEEDAP